MVRLAAATFCGNAYASQFFALLSHWLAGHQAGLFCNVATALPTSIAMSGSSLRSD
jgi:hypothetical protein